ncbi:MAG: AraC family transcriptional regulator [Lachnospiraceae bacterium]|nr:AraC family transcriptional regulator [Lachnospiraceae bacterium]
MQTSELEYIERTAQMPLICKVVSIENSSPHWHHEYETFFVLRGSVVINCEDSEWRLEAGDIFLFNAREIHSINQPEPDNLCLVLQFNPEIFAGVYSKSFWFSLNTRLENGIPDKVIEMMRRDLAKIALLVYEKPNGYQFFIKSCLYNYVGSMFKHLPYQVKSEAQLPIDDRLKDFDAIKQYIKKRFAEDISIDQMCRDLAMSRAKIYRVMKEAGSESYKSLVNYYRVENAKDLLRNTDFSIQYIETASGFESGSSFYRIFKELTSVSPNRYRERPQSKDVPLGVQGYVGYSVPKALEILRQYSR